MTKWKDQRKLSNLIIDRRAFARLSIPFLIMALVSSAIVYAIHWKVMTALEALELFGIENLPAINALHELHNSVTTFGAYGVLLMAMICFGLWIVSSHRVFGPTVSMRRHIQRLTAGDYSSRMHVRQGYEFKQLSEELNQLAEVLEQNAKTEKKAG